MRMLAFDVNHIVNHQDRPLPKLLKDMGVHLLEEDDQTMIDFSKVDAVITGGTLDDGRKPYLIAIALAKLKPVIYLQPQGQVLDKSVANFLKEKNGQDLLFIIEFEKKNLRKLLSETIGKMEATLKEEAASLKFTLRITPSMERYLQWKSQETGMTKADFLRQSIQEKIISPDESYQK